MALGIGTETAIGAGIGAASNLIGLIGQKKREERSNKQTERLMDIQNKNQRALNEQGAALNLKNATNYKAHGEGMDAAGLSRGLMYGGSGQGGTTAGSGGNAAMGSATQPQPMDVGGIASGAEAMSRVLLNKAAAKKADAEADNLRGGTGTIGEGTIAKLAAETSNEALKGELMKAQTAQSLEQALAIVENVRGMKIINDVNEETKQDAIKAIQQNAINLEVDKRLKEQQITLSAEQQDAIKHKVYSDYIKAGAMGVNALSGGITNVIKQFVKKGIPVKK